MDKTIDLELSTDPQLALESVPWTRKGHPGYYESQSNTWSSFVANVGSSPPRLHTDEELVEMGARNGGRISLSYLEERALLHVWDYQNNGYYGTREKSYLHGILRPEVEALLHNDHDIEVAEKTAASVIMWLGSNIGRSFLREAFQLAKREQARLQPKVAAHMLFLKSVGEVPAHAIPLNQIPKAGTRRLKRKAVKGKKA